MTKTYFVFESNKSKFVKKCSKFWSEIGRVIFYGTNFGCKSERGASRLRMLITLKLGPRCAKRIACTKFEPPKIFPGFKIM